MVVLAQPGDGAYRRLSEVLQRYHGSPGYPLARFGSLEVHCKCTYHCKCNYHCKVVCILPFPWALDSTFCSILSRESRGIPQNHLLNIESRVPWNPLVKTTGCIMLCLSLG